MKPGPATATASTAGCSPSSAASASARSRGLRPACLARTIAALVERSPCSGSRGGSTVTLEVSSPAGIVPAALRVARAVSTTPRKWVKTFMVA